MFSRKFVLTSCLAIATSMLAGCASYKNESGLPKWLDDASEANRLGYFMGISLKDSPAPEGFDPSKNTLVSDVTFSAAAHGLNAATGAMDIGSFGVELGLSLATNILKREEEEYSQANVYCNRVGARGLFPRASSHTTWRTVLVPRGCEQSSECPPSSLFFCLHTLFPLPTSVDRSVPQSSHSEALPCGAFR